MLAAAASDDHLTLALDALAVVVEFGLLAEQQVVVLIALALCLRQVCRCFRCRLRRRRRWIAGVVFHDSLAIVSTEGTNCWF